MKRRAALGVAASALALGGCINVAANVDVAADNAITGTATIQLSRAAATLMGIDSAASLRTQLSGEDTVPAGMTVSVQEKGDDLVIDLAGPLKETGGMLTATRQGNVQTFTVTNNQAQTEADPADNSGTPEPSAGSADRLVVTARFTGTVTSTEGGFAQQQAANIVRFAGPIGEVWTSSATIDLSQPVTTAASSSSGSVLGWLAGAGLLAIMLVLVVARIRGRSRPDSPDPR